MSSILEKQIPTPEFFTKPLTASEKACRLANRLDNVTHLGGCNHVDAELAGSFSDVDLEALPDDARESVLLLRAGILEGVAVDGTSIRLACTAIRESIREAMKAEVWPDGKPAVPASKPELLPETLSAAQKAARLANLFECLLSASVIVKPETHRTPELLAVANAITPADYKEPTPPLAANAMDFLRRVVLGERQMRTRCEGYLDDLRKWLKGVKQ